MTGRVCRYPRSGQEIFSKRTFVSSVNGLANVMLRKEVFLGVRGCCDCSPAAPSSVRLRRCLLPRPPGSHGSIVSLSIDAKRSLQLFSSGDARADGSRPVRSQMLRRVLVYDKTHERAAPMVLVVSQDCYCSHVNQRMSGLKAAHRGCKCPCYRCRVFPVGCLVTSPIVIQLISANLFIYHFFFYFV